MVDWVGGLVDWWLAGWLGGWIGVDTAAISGSQCFADADTDRFLFSNFAKIEKGCPKFR